MKLIKISTDTWMDPFLLEMRKILNFNYHPCLAVKINFVTFSIELEDSRIDLMSDNFRKTKSFTMIGRFLEPFGRLQSNEEINNLIQA